MKKPALTLAGIIVALLIAFSANARPLAKRPPSRAGSSSSPTCNQTSFELRAIPLGVSGSNLDSIGNGYCYTGILGSLVQDNLGNPVSQPSLTQLATSLATSALPW